MIRKPLFGIVLSALWLAGGSFARPNAPDDLLISANPDPNEIQKLSSKEVTEDLSLLGYALKRAYGGRKFLPKAAWQALGKDLHSLPGSGDGLSSLELCRRIESSLLKIPDRHIHARTFSSDCGLIASLPTPKVGSNILAGKKQNWEVQYRTSAQRRVPVLAIRSFPSHLAPEWNGFEERVRELKATAPALIIDLRGNPGGDDTKGLRMAKSLYGSDPASPIDRRVWSQTAETSALRINSVRLNIWRLQQAGSPVPQALQDGLAQELRNFDSGKQGQIPAEKEIVYPGGSPFDPALGFQKPIFALIDSGCASSCESTLAALENHPYVIRVGENTMGAIHFGNLGLMVLPRSHIQIWMGTDFWKFKDGRLLEKIGYAPDWRVPPYTDALEFVLKKIE